MRKLAAGDVRDVNLRLRITRPLLQRIEAIAAQERRSVSLMAQILIEESISEREHVAEQHKAPKRK
jgi:hypothetical protein